MVKISDFKKELENKYDIICFVDLADIVHKHGEIFRLFKLYYQKEYTNNQRLIFYSSSTNIDQNIFNHLQYAAARIDISNFFILICTPQDISNQLILANQLYGYDDSVIGCFSVALESTKEINSIGIYSRESMCPLPFGMISIDPKETASVCCKINQKIKINGQELPEVFQNQQILNLREKIKIGKRAPECRACWNIEDRGGTSARLHALSKYRDVCDLEWVDDPKIRAIDISNSSLCNFKCRICNSDYSSQWALENLKYSDSAQEKLKIRESLKNDSKSSLHDQLNKHGLKRISKNLLNLHILGGEPFMLPGLDDLMDDLIANGHANHIELDINTNGSIWPEKIIDRLQYFKKSEILLSIDNLGPRFEIERGGSWSDVENNIRKFSLINSERIKVTLAVTINIQNLLYLDELIQFAKKMDLEILWWYLEVPSLLAIDRTTQTTKKLVYQKYHDHPNDELVKIANRMLKTAPDDGIKFLDYMAQLDQRRGQRFDQTHREIFHAMGGKISDH